MPGEHSYAMRATWTGERGSGTSGYRDYDRSVTLEVEGKPALLGSADAPFRGDPARWNPEDMLLASLVQCHLLSYLHACVTAGVVVTAYHDDATATLVLDGTGDRMDDSPETTEGDSRRYEQAASITHDTVVIMQCKLWA